MQFDVLKGMTDVFVSVVAVLFFSTAGVVLGNGRTSAILLSTYLAIVIFDAVPAQWLIFAHSFYAVLGVFLVIVLTLASLGRNVFAIGGSRRGMQIEWSAAVLGVLAGVFISAILARMMPLSAMSWMMTENIYTLLTDPLVLFFVTILPVGFLLFIYRR